jgi:predicted Zn-dependent protease
MKKTSFAIALVAFVSFSLFTGCKGNKPGGGGMNLFSVEQDAELGLQVKQQIESDRAQFPILNEANNKEAYQIIRSITNEILNSGKVYHRKQFVWEVKLIDDDKTLNAFCTPGGYIYVYSGLIKYLDKEDQLAGVMGHEIAHADQRHSTRQMTTMYGLNTLISAISGNRETLAQITSGLIGLKFGRKHETEADNYSVEYLGGTRYNCAGAAGFFEKISSEGGGSTPEFLSTHPNPGNRVQNIKAKAASKGCKTTNTTNQSRYQKLKNLL